MIKKFHYYSNSTYYTATVISTTNCAISIGGVIDGSKIVPENYILNNIIIATPSANYQLVGYIIYPENGAFYRVNVGNNISMPQDNITITPISLVIESLRKFTTMGYGSQGYHCAVYDTVNLVVTNTYIDLFTPQTGNLLMYEWGNFMVQDYNIPSGYIADPRYIAKLPNGSYNRNGAGTYGNTIRFVFGLSEDEVLYVPWGFEITEVLDDTQTQTTIVLGSPAVITDYGQSSFATTNAVYGSMTLLYPTNVHCLVVPAT